MRSHTRNLKENNTFRQILSIVWIGIAVPVLEENMFRGNVLPAFAVLRNYLGLSSPQWEIGIQTLLFALLHTSSNQSPRTNGALVSYTAALGWIFGRLSVSGSLWVPIALHSLNNVHILVKYKMGHTTENMRPTVTRKPATPASEPKESLDEQAETVLQLLDQNQASLEAS